MRRNDLRGGLESALQGASTLVTPSLLFMGILGSIAAAPSLWGTLLAITLVPAVRLWLGGSAMVIAAPRSASTATYVALVLHMGLAASGSPVGDSNTLLTASQLRLGLAVASLMYLFASLLVTLSGVIKLGRVFKMIPNPVTSGISNGTAMLLLMLAVNKVTEGGLPTALTAVVMVLASFGWSWVQQKHSAYANQIPAILLALAMGYAGSAVLGDAQHTAISGPSDGILSTQWLSFNLWKSLDTGHLGALLMLAVPGTITLALVMVLETFTTSSTMEIRFGVRSHADRELIALGCANMLGAVLGGLPCTGSSIYSVSSWLSGGRSKLASWACYGLSGLMMLCFTPWLMALPGGIAAGLLVLQSLLMVNPVFVQSLAQLFRTRRWQKPGPQDLGFWITVVISLVGFFGNLIWACFAGVGLSCLAVLRRVSANLTAHWMYLDAMRSRRIRVAAESDALSQLAHHVGILQLTGHLFFGNSGRITQLADELDEDSLCVVIDVSLVHDVDPSGLDALAWLARTLVDRKLQVVVAGLNKTRVLTLQKALNKLPGLVHCVDLDRGLEHCEEWVLQNATALPRAQQARPIEANGLLQGLTDDEITAVLLVVDMRQVAKGEVLFRKDERSDGVWMLQAGQVSILAGGGAQAARLATFGPGQFVGEMGFIDGNTRSATVTADTAVEAVLLDSNAVAALVRDQPDAALKITRNIARELSQRVRTTSAVLTRDADAAASTWENSALSVFSR
jgi:SulP family sulfate permease